MFWVTLAFSQTYKVEYTYDQAGNRKSRVVITINSRSFSADEEETPLQQELKKCKVTIYPNPTRGLLNIDISNGEDHSSYNVAIFSSSGQKLLEVKQTGNGNLPVDLSGYSPGIYIATFKYEGGEVEYKIIKQ